MPSGAALRPMARRTVHRALYWTAAALGLAARLSRRRPEPCSGAVHRILLIRLDLLGDVLFSLQAAEGMRAAYPDARITMVTLPYTAPLARASSAVDEVIELDANRVRRPSGALNPATWIAYRRAFHAMRGARYDLGISLAGRTASLVAFLSGACRTFGYADEAYPFLLTDPVPGGRYGERKHEV